MPNYHKNKEKYSQRSKEYRKKYPEKTSNWLKKYRQTEKGMKTLKNYKQQDQFKIATRLRTRLRTAVKLYNANKIDSTLEYLGCPLWYFMAYLRAHFTQDMNWQMLMNGDLELDHLIPFCSLDLTIEENLKKVCHYTNIRPIFARDNHSKASKDRLLSIH